MSNTKITMNNGDVIYTLLGVEALVEDLSVGYEFVALPENMYINPKEVSSVGVAEDGPELGSLVKFSGGYLVQSEYWVRSVEGWHQVDDYPALTDEEFFEGMDDVNYNVHVYNVED